MESFWAGAVNTALLGLSANTLYFIRNTTIYCSLLDCSTALLPTYGSPRLIPVSANGVPSVSHPPPPGCSGDRSQTDQPFYS